MTAYAEALRVVRAARAARDEARDAQYALQLRRLALDGARRREARGEGTSDPAQERALRALATEVASIESRLADIAARRAALAQTRDEIAALRREVDAAPRQSAALAASAADLADQLRAAESPRTRDVLRDRIAAVQAARAALAERTKADRDLLAGLEVEARADEALGNEAREIEASLRARRGDLAALRERARHTDLDAEAAKNAEAVDAARSRGKRRADDLRAAIDGLFDGRTPPQLIEEWDDSLPILLLPARLETRWQTDAGGGAGARLLVRVYPDDVAVTTHEPTLTDAEVTRGEAYWSAWRAAAIDSALDAEARAAAQRTAWGTLAERSGTNRAAWVALQTKPRNWDAALADGTLPLDFPPAPLTKPDAWSVAPHTRVMPDRWVLLAWRSDELRVMQVGEPVDDVLVLGPAPLDDEGDDAVLARGADGSLDFGDAFAWVRDFDAAVRRGMAFRVDVAAADAAAGFDRLLVLGLKLSADADDARQLVETLLDDHRYSRSGLELLRQGTPTNNTGDAASGWTRADRGAAASPAAGTSPPRFEPSDDRALASDGQRLADLLGLDYAALRDTDGADAADNAEAVSMNRALYAGTLGYYLDHMLAEVVDEPWLAEVRRHFTDLVTGRGPIAAIRVGSQPYGILPTSALARWKPGTVRRDDRGAAVAIEAAVAAAAPDRFETGLLRVLTRLDAEWTKRVPRLKQVGGAGGGAENLLDVLALHPTSAEFFQRVGYSWDYLKNLESFAWGGAEMDDAISMAVEAMAARALLTDLGAGATRADGTPKPHPLLLQLIWRHYHTRIDAKQLIDGRPLSERDGIAPYDAAATRTYVDWLLDNAADAAALEAQSFGTGATRPGALLYMMLHFALVMEASRGIHRWLGERGVVADELVRSRKFLNVGAQPSPSVWEVMRAPANRIAQGDASNRPLLEVVNAPQASAGAGEWLRQQREALERLRALPTARLERALVEHVDTLSYRLDAWETSLFARRLHRQRRLDAPVSQRRTGVYLGGYGYLERVRPAAARAKVAETTLPDSLRTGVDDLYESAAAGGYVHAPSLNHATAAALLRSGYLTHATPADPDALAVDLSSARVRRARYLVDGVRNGQSLEVLLGVQFERGLHDWTTRSPNPVILDQLKPLFRAAFPIERTKIPQAADAGDGASIVSEDYHVTNGVTLARSTAAFPYGITELQTLSTAQRDAIVAEKEAIATTLDALHDVLTAEAAYQLALGNFDRAAAVVQSVGSATMPPDLEVLATPRGNGIAFTQRVAVQLSAGAVATPWNTIAMTERARLEPSINAWLGDLLGDPATVRCTAAALDDDGAVLVDGGGPVRGFVRLADLELQPIDFVYAVRSQVEESGAAELEARVRDRFARDRGLADGVVVRVAFADSGDPAMRSFAEVLPLADRLRRLLGTARALDARHFRSATADDPGSPDNPGRIDVAELRGRVGTRLGAVRALVAALPAAAAAARATPTAATVGALRSALRAVADCGVAYALPRSSLGASAAEAEMLAQQAEALVKRADTLGPATDDRLAAADAATQADRKLTLLAEAVRAWMGGDMVLLPRFTFHDAAAVDQADAARDDLIAYARDTVGIPLPVDEWLHGAACVREHVHDLEMIRAMAEAASDEPLAFSVLQLPYRAGDAWLGAEHPSGTAVVHDTVSIVQHLPQGFAAAGAQCGLLVDDWVESLPSRDEVTGVAFNYDAPNSAPPQALLLAVTPNETGHWSWDDLVASVLDTFRRARLRAVEPDMLGDLPGIGTLLPAVIAEFGTSRGSVSLDYSFAHDEVRLPALAEQRATRTGAGVGGG